MKNITFSIDEDILKAARIYAAANDTTVSALVRDYLARLAAEEDKAARARARLIELSQASTAEVGPITWRREDLYER